MDNGSKNIYLKKDKLAIVVTGYEDLKVPEPLIQGTTILPLTTYDTIFSWLSRSKVYVVSAHLV